MGRRVLAVVIAALLALVGVAAVLLYAKGADSRAVAGAQPQTVYVSDKLVPSGTLLADAVRDGLLVRTSVAAKAMPVGALTDVTEKNQQLLAVTDILPGEYVLESRFGTTPSGTRAIQVPNGQVAISVSLSDPARVGSFVTPGSHVVIYDTFQLPVPAQSGPAAPGAAAVAPPAQTRVLLQDVLVIAMGNTSLTPVAQGGQAQPQPQAQGGAQTTVLVTVAVTPEDATRLVHGVNTGKLYAGLRGTDVKVDLNASVSDASMFTK